MVIAHEVEEETDYQKAVRLIRSGRFSDAIVELTKAASLDPNNDETFAALCLTAHETELHDSTFEFAMVRLWLSPYGAAFKRALALDRCRKGLSAEAIVYALEAVFLNPKDPLSIYVLGLSYMAAKEYSFAERSLRRALELEPDFAVARSKLDSISACLHVTRLRAQLEST